MNEDELLADLLEGLARRGLVEAAPRVEAAFRLAAQAHQGQWRSDGKAYVAHPARVARLLLEEWEVRDPDVLVASLLHDAVEDSPLTLAEVEARFGADVRELVDVLTKPGVDQGPDAGGPEAVAAAKAARDEAYFARLATASEAAVTVKAADRVDNLRDVLAARWPEQKKRDYVREAEEKLLPVVRARCPERAEALEAVCREVTERLDRGEGDVPDVGPNDDVGGDAMGAGGVEDPTYRLSPHLSFFRRGPDVYLYHDLVGDIMQLHEKVLGFLDYFREPRRESEARTVFADEFMPGDLDAFFETLSQHLVLLPDGGPDDAAVTRDWYPVHGPWIVTHRPVADGKKQALRVCYKDRRAGEPVVEVLSPLLGRLYRLCDGTLKVSEIVTRLRRLYPQQQDVEQVVRATVRAWTHSQRQLLKLLPRPASAYEMVGLPPYALSAMPYPLLRKSDAPAPEEPEGTREYHKLEIASADEQFDLKETTLSHALRVPHPALGGRTYGGALAQVLVQRDVLPDQPQATFRLVEVGGGTGFFARCFLDGLALRAPRLYNRLRYTIVELAPALRASQRERTRPHADRLRIVGGDAERLPLADASVDCVVSNEVIADLRVAAVRRQDVDGSPGPEDGGEGAELVRRYGLPVDDAPGLFFLNLGALRYLEEIQRVLRPGGTALLTEYGALDRYPEESTHLDHAEFSIHFGHLKVAAERMGLETTVEDLPTLLGLDGTVPVLKTTQSSFETLRAYLATWGVRLEKLAYTPDMLRETLGEKVKLEHFTGVDFEPCGQRVLGLKPHEFQALVIRKPRRAGREVRKASLDI